MTLLNRPQASIQKNGKWRYAHRNLSPPNAFTILPPLQGGKTIHKRRGVKTTMNIKKIINSALTIMGLALVAAGAQAQTEFTSITGGNNSFTYTSGAGNGLVLTSPAGFYATLDIPTPGTQFNNPATVIFTPGSLVNSGITTTTTSGGQMSFTQGLTGGGFTIYNGSGTSGTVLLTGTFQGANLTGVVNSIQAGVDTNFMNVAYTGGSYLSAAGMLTGSQPGDKFNFSLIPVTPALGVTGNTLNSFSSAGNGQFTGVLRPATVPEPASIIPFALGGLGLLGLIARKTRRTGGAAA